MVKSDLNKLYCRHNVESCLWFHIRTTDIKCWALVRDTFILMGEQEKRVILVTMDVTVTCVGKHDDKPVRMTSAPVLYRGACQPEVLPTGQLYHGVAGVR